MKTLGRLPSVKEQEIILALYVKGSLTIKQMVTSELLPVSAQRGVLVTMAERGFITRTGSVQEVIQLTRAAYELAEVCVRHGWMSSARFLVGQGTVSSAVNGHHEGRRPPVLLEGVVSPPSPPAIQQAPAAEPNHNYLVQVKAGKVVKHAPSVEHIIRPVAPKARPPPAKRILPFNIPPFKHPGSIPRRLLGPVPPKRRSK